MSIWNQFSNFLIKKIDHLVIKYLTVERGRNRRKWIWKTQKFRELTQLYIPRCLFISFGVLICWKIHEKIKFFKKGELYYEAKSLREEKVEQEMKVLLI